MNKLINSNNFCLSIIFFVFICSRLIIFYFFGIEPSKTISQYWQLFHLELLHKDLFNTLIYSHTQPFLWNLIVGGFLKLNNGNESFTIMSMLFFNFILSILILYYSYYILSYFNFSNLQKLICVILLCIYPGLFFFENLIFYSQITCFLIFQVFFLFLKYINTKNDYYEILIYINFLVLGFIWTAFHPLIIIITFCLIHFLNKKFPKIKSFIFLFTVLCVSALPIVKNKIIFGISSSGWTGFYLCQTIVFKANIPECTHNVSSSTEFHQNEYFKKYKKDKDKLNHPNLTIGPLSKRHNLGFIIASDNLLEKTKKFIIQNPEKYLSQRVHAILASHGKFSFDYGIRPNNWEKTFSFFLKVESDENLKLYRQIFVFLIMITIYVNLILFLIKNNNIREKQAIIFIGVLYTYFFALSIATNGHEHERIMFTWVVLNFLSLSLLLKKFLKF